MRAAANAMVLVSPEAVNGPLSRPSVQLHHGRASRVAVEAMESALRKRMVGGHGQRHVNTLRYCTCSIDYSGSDKGRLINEHE